MKKLDSKVNIIPVIAKADTISKPELQRFKVMPVYFLLLVLANNNFSFLLLTDKDHVRACFQWSSDLPISSR